MSPQRVPWRCRGLHPPERGGESPPTVRGIGGRGNAKAAQIIHGDGYTSSQMLSSMPRVTTPICTDDLKTVLRL
eukprot:1185806-Prorocentrum_minimum.AAC.2